MDLGSNKVVQDEGFKCLIPSTEAQQSEERLHIVCKHLRIPGTM